MAIYTQNFSNLARNGETILVTVTLLLDLLRELSSRVTRLACVDDAQERDRR
jgi:hypothetical protein